MMRIGKFNLIKIFKIIDFFIKNDIIIKIIMEVTNMSIEKQMLYNEIDELPEELTRQVFNFIEYLKMSYIDSEAPDSIKIKSKKDLKEKLQKGLDDIKENKVYSLDEFFAKIDNV